MHDNLLHSIYYALKVIKNTGYEMSHQSFCSGMVMVTVYLLLVAVMINVHIYVRVLLV